jgi:carboxymethylenebutenolidase
VTEKKSPIQDVIDLELELETASGEVNTFVALPDTGSSDQPSQPSPVILFLMDAPGMREELRDMCRRIASNGYFVIAPNLYYREVRQYNVFETQDRDRMFELMDGLSNAMVIEDVRAIFGWSHNHLDADATRIATVGYCMSGPFALMVASTFPDHVKAAASIHGVRLATDQPDSPHRNLDPVKAEIYVACAETDSYAPPETIAEFEAAMVAAGTAGRVEWYPGTEHGFAFAERDQYVREASERHWDQLLDLFERNLK